MLSAVRTRCRPSCDTVNRVSVPYLLPLLQIEPRQDIRLVLRHRYIERFQRAASLVDLVEQWVRLNIRIEDTRIVKLRDQIEIGDGRFVIEGESGLRRSGFKLLFHNLVAVMRPMIVPALPICIVLAMLCHEVCLHTAHIDRVHLAGNNLRERPRPRPHKGVVGEQ